jgi:hypothetical protein
MTNPEIREWYLREVASIAGVDADRQSRGDSLESRARLAWQERHALRLRAREMMENRSEVLALKLRDRQLYGSEDGPTFEQLLDRLRSSGLTGNDIFGLIIRSSQTTSEAVNKLLGL